MDRRTYRKYVFARCYARRHIHSFAQAVRVIAGCYARKYTCFFAKVAHVIASVGESIQKLLCHSECTARRISLKEKMLRLKPQHDEEGYASTPLHFLPSSFAFTLAEVLITLGIIGVVAALTIPVLVNKINDARDSAQLKEIYSIMSQATALIKYDNGGTLVNRWSNYWCSNNEDCFMPTYAKYIKSNNVCTTFQNSDDCWHKSGTWFDADNTVFTSCDGCASLHSNKGFWMTNTASIVINDACTTSIANEYDDICYAVLIDINGAQKPNKVEEDIHRFYVTKNGFFPTKSGRTAELLK